MVRKITSGTGVISTVAGNYSAGPGFSGDGGLATAAQFDGTAGIAVDNAGSLFILDQGNYCIRKVSPSGFISAFAGTPTMSGSTGDGGPATAAKFILGIGMKFNSDQSKLFIADGLGNKVRVIDMSGSNTISTIAGTGAYGFSGDGGPASSAVFAAVEDVAIDNGGNIYIADMHNARIRKIDVYTGDVSTVAGSVTIGYAGDGSAATSSAVEIASSFVNVDAAGNLYLSGIASNYPIRYVCSSTTPDFTITSTPADGSTTCVNMPITFSANTVNGGCGTYYWYKLVSSTPVMVGTGLTYVDYHPTTMPRDAVQNAIPEQG